MNEKKVFGTIFFILILVSALSLTACQTVSPAQASAEFDYEQAAAHTASRWTAMAQAYEKDDLLGKPTDAGDVTVQRWNAMAEAYTKQELGDRGPSPNEAMVNRWLAMGKAYEQ